MKEREYVVTSGLAALLLLVWLGFAMHRAPQFAGSMGGGLLAIAGSLLMLVPLLYLVIKRVRWLKRAVTRRVSMPTLLAIHIYAGLLGPILVILHTGHRFGSPLGIALTAMTIIVAISGYLGRHVMRRVSSGQTEHENVLAGLEASYRYFQSRYQQLIAELTALPEQSALIAEFGRLLPHVARRAFADPSSTLAPVARVVEVSQAMADVEYAIRTHQLFKRLFRGWLKLHIALSLILYSLLALHVWSGIHFGLRWFR